MSKSPLIKEGKKPLTQKKKLTFAPWSSQNKFDIPATISDYLQEEGLEARWINAIQLSKNSGYHKNGWRPLPLDYVTIDASDSSFVSGPDNRLYRGDCVLAVRPQEHGQAHRKELKERADRQYSRASGANSDLKQAVKEVGRGVKIVEGYDD